MKSPDGNGVHRIIAASAPHVLWNLPGDPATYFGYYSGTAR
jgi:hypothetical protein